MKKKQALLRIESLIETDYKQIKEYNFFYQIQASMVKKIAEWFNWNWLKELIRQAEAFYKKQ